LRLSFELLLKLDAPELEYQEWVKGLTLPEAVKELKGVNLDDGRQWHDVVYSSLRKCKTVIDFYLSNHVFPQAAKDFPYKLTTNSWDLAEDKTFPITGFSGTNDNRYLLPPFTLQRDLEEHLHTNALVLMYLLQQENRVIRVSSEKGERLDATQLLSVIMRQRSPVRVLLDIGAQVLELRNDEVAATWLRLNESPDILAAIFFSGADELMVMKRNGSTELLQQSAMLHQLDRCLVYLDEAHTRGTDLKLPAGTRAAATLGPDLPKDKLVQGELSFARR
jgi:hypothetical protein